MLGKPGQAVKPVVRTGMARMLEYRGYLGAVDADEGAFVGRVARVRDVFTFAAATFAEVEQASSTASTTISPSAPNAASRPTAAARSPSGWTRTASPCRRAEFGRLIA